LRAPRVPTRQRNGLQKSETMSANRTLQLFAQRLQGYWHGILARCRHPLNTSVVEGINNTIKVIKRRAYGYRDEEYFFLKIRAAFPGNPR
ncbi:transposase, partial [Burkholderia cepacia]